VRVGFDRPEVIDRDHLDILATVFDDGPENVAADAAESVRTFRLAAQVFAIATR
jgi:hypothetical protein